VTDGSESSEGKAAGGPAARVPSQAPPIESERPAPVVTSEQSLTADLWREVLLLQLSECWNDVRNVDSIVWQIPAGIGAILGLILTAVAPRIASKPSVFEMVGVFGAAFVTLSLVYALRKNRLLQKYKSKYIKSIYHELLQTDASKARHGVSIAALKPVDIDIRVLPGLVALSTGDIQAVMGQGDADSSHSLASRLRHMSAFNLLFWVSVSVLVGEYALGIWMLVRIVN
jgi:hypothetical protein